MFPPRANSRSTDDREKHRTRSISCRFSSTRVHSVFVPASSRQGGSVESVLNYLNKKEGRRTQEPTIRERGRLGPRAGIPKRLRPNCQCMSPRSRGVGTLRVCRPADYLPPGTVGQWPPVTGQWWVEQQGCDPGTGYATMGTVSKLPGWQPEENAAQLPRKRGTLKTQRGWHQCTKREGAQGPQCTKGWDPRTPASRRHWLLQLVAATVGVTLYSIVFWLMSPFWSRRSTCQFSSTFSLYREGRRTRSS